MNSKYCGGERRRGRPALTPEQRREKGRIRRAKNRRRVAEEQYARLTNSTRVVELEVLHWLDLLELLVVTGLLDQRDVKNIPKIEDAVEDLLNYHLNYLRELAAARKKGEGLIYRLFCELPATDYRPTQSGPGTVRYWVDVDDAEALGLDFDDTRQLEERLGYILFSWYSNINDLRRPDAYGIPWGSFSYARGEKAFEEWQPKPEPDPTWTESEAKAAQEKWRLVSRTAKRMSMKERSKRWKL